MGKSLSLKIVSPILPLYTDLFDRIRYSNKYHYKKEFDKANEKEKLYEPTDSCGTYVKTAAELVDAINQRAPNIIARIDGEDKIVRIDDIELDRVKELKIYNVRDLRLYEKRLPEFLDLSQCDAMIDLEGKDFSKVKKISLPKRCDLSNIAIFPEIVDASQCEGLRAIKSNVRKLDFSKMKKDTTIAKQGIYLRINRCC